MIFDLGASSTNYLGTFIYLKMIGLCKTPLLIRYDTVTIRNLGDRLFRPLSLYKLLASLSV